MFTLSHMRSKAYNNQSWSRMSDGTTPVQGSKFWSQKLYLPIFCEKIWTQWWNRRISYYFLL